MTNEEALELLKDTNLILRCSFTGDIRIVEAIDMAIKALGKDIDVPTKEIIHCKDCKYSIDEYNDGDCYCKRPSRELVWIGKSWDFFCKAGAKREGEEHE